MRCSIVLVIVLPSSPQKLTTSCFPIRVTKRKRKIRSEQILALQNASRNPVAFLSSPRCQFGESPGKKSPGRNEETFDRINFMPNFTFEGCGRNVASRFSHQRRKEEIPKAPKNSVLPPKVPAASILHFFSNRRPDTNRKRPLENVKIALPFDREPAF